MTVFSRLLIFLTLANLAAAQNYVRPRINGNLTCSREPGGYGCPPDWCCSVSGFCGRTEDHCRGTERFPHYKDVEGPLTFDAVADPSQPNLEPLDNNHVVHAYYFRSMLDTVSPEMIPAEKLTHLIYAFARVNHQFELYTESPSELDLFARILAAIRNRNPNIKFLISIGGALQNEEGQPTIDVFTTMVETQASRRIFIQNAMAFARRYNFDGFDLDWEFPGDYKLGGRPQDKENLVLLMQEWHAAVLEESQRTGNTRFLLTMALIPSYSLVGFGYDLPRLHNHIDWINLMTYELHYAVDTVTGPHTGLSNNPQGDVEDSLYQFDMVPGHKLAMGIAAFAKAFYLAEGSACAYGQRATGFAPEIRYNEVLELLRENPSIAVRRDEVTHTSYFCHNRILYSYDSPDDVTAKMDFINNMGLRGAFVWTLDQDDAVSDFPLTTRMTEGLRNPISVTITPNVDDFDGTAQPSQGFSIGSGHVAILAISLIVGNF